MRKNLTKRILAMALTLVMTLSLLPTQAFAVDSGADDHEHCKVCGQHECVCDAAEVCETCGNEVCTCEDAEEPADLEESEPVYSDAYLELQSMIDDMLCWYLLGIDRETEEDIASLANLTRADVESAVAAMDSDTLWQAQVELADLEATMEAYVEYEELTQTEAETLMGNNEVFGWFAEKVDGEGAAPSLLGDKPFLDGKITITNSTGTVNTASGTTYKITAGGGAIGRQTVTLTIKNTSDSTGKISFTYSASNYGSFTLKGASAGSSGSVSETIAANDSFQMVIAGRSGLFVGDATLTLSNIAFEAAAASSKVTFNYDTTLGSVTVAGSAVANGETVDISSSGAALVATPKSGAIFLGWTGETGEILSTEASYTLIPTAAMTVKAIFAKDGGSAVFALGSTTSKTYSEKLLGIFGTDFAYYQVAKTHLFDNLGDAIVAAQNGSSKAIVLMNNGTISSGYTIPNGVTLLIPYNDANTMSTTQPLCKGEVGKPAALESIVAYRTLTMAPGASLTVANGGAINVNAEVFGIGGSDLGGGTPLGGYGYVKMQSGSSITLENGGKLYCYGYIGGSGTVTAKSGASVYEMFQIERFRGGDQTSSLATDTKHGVFPMNSYYVQNILAPLTLEYGATEYAYASLYMSSSLHGTSIKFISSSGAMFNMGEGASVTKEYSYADDRLIITAHSGTMSISNISMSISDISINSKDFDLPINGNMTIVVESGSTIEMKQDVALLPGVEVYINKGAKCRLVSAANSTANLFIYDMDQWPTTLGEGYVGDANYPLFAAYFVPERQYTRQHTVTTNEQGETAVVKSDLKDVYFEVAGEVIIDGNVYTTGTATTGGAAITGVEGAIVTAKKPAEDYDPGHYQMIQKGDPANSNFVKIDITPAKLKNADGTYVASADSHPTVYTTYTYTDGVWVPKCQVIDGVAQCVAIEGTTATCVEKAICKYCGATTAVGNHDWGEVTYTWSVDNSSCTATMACAHDSENHVQKETVDTTKSGRAASCKEEGQITYTAIFLSSWIPEKEQVKNVVEPILPHTMEAVSAKDATCTASGNYAYYVCSACDGVFEDAEGTKPTTKDAQIIPQLNHVFTNYVYQNNATCVNNGTEIAECDTCETNAMDERSVEGTKLEHNFITEVTTPPTCEGRGVETTYCPNGCGEAETKSIPAIGHEWTVSYDWAEDGKKCVATRACGNDASHNLTREATIGAKVDKDATCTEMGDTKYTATFTFGEEEEEWASTQTKVVTDIPATEHVWTVDYKWAEDGSACVATRICGNDASHNVTCEATITSAESKAPTCTEEGETTYTATFDVEWAETQTETVADIPAKEHAWSVSYKWEEDGSACVATRICGNDASHNVTCEATITSAESKAPTCTEEGDTTYTAIFAVAWATKQAKTVTDIAAKEHAWTVDYDWAEDGSACVATRICGNDASHNVTCDATITSAESKAPTCTEEGETKYTATFTVEGEEQWAETQTKTVADIPAKEHAWTVDYDWAEDGSTCLATRVCENDESHKESANATIKSEVAQAPACEEMGETKYTATFGVEWAETQTETITDIPALSHKDADHNHACDNGCDVYQGEHVDLDPKDHICDYGCEEVIGTHADIDHDEAHLCDYCCVKARDHQYTNGVCDCDYVKDLSVSLVITASGADNVVVPQETIKYGADYAATLDFSAFGNCFTMQTVSIKVGGSEIAAEDYNYNAVSDKLTIDGSAVIGDIEIVVTAIQRHTSGEVENSYTAPTCTEAGKFVTVVHCGDCGVPVSTTTTPIPATGHNNGKGFIAVRTEATFQADAYITYSCGACDDDYVEILEGTRLTAIALIGEDEYETLDEAIAAAEEGDTIVLQTQVAVEGEATWDLTGITLETADCGYAYGLVIRGKLTINGGTFVANGMYGIGVTATGNLTINDGEFKVNGDNDYLIGSYGATTINGGTFAGQYNCVNGFDGTVAIKGGSFATADTDCTGEYDSEDVMGNVSVSGGTYSKDVVDYLAEGYCRKSMNATYVVGAHIGGEIQTENVTAATCKKTGSHDEVTYCEHCGEETSRETKVDNVIPHTEVVDAYKAPTCEGTGLTEGSHCSACGETIVDQEEIPETGHAYDDGKYLVDADKPTCTEPGVKTYTCGNDGNHTYTEVVAATDHAWSISYQWADNGSICVATRACANDAKHNVTCEAAITSAESKAPTCTDKGETKYTATFDVEWAETQNKTVADILAKEHAWSVSYKWEEDGSACVATRACANDAKHNVTCEATITSAESKAPTCTDKGETKYTATFDVEWAETQNKTVADILAKEHAWSVSYKWEEDGSACVATRICGNDASHNVTCDATITSEEALAPTCEDKGKTKYTAAFDVEWAESKSKTVEDIDALNHDWDITYTWSADNSICQASAVCKNDCGYKANGTATITFQTESDATCEADGSRTYTATFRNEIFTTQVKNVTLERLGHSYTNYVSNNDATCADDGTKTASCNNGCGMKETIADEGSAKGHSKNPDIISGKVTTCAAAGYKGCYQCLVCQNYFEESGCVTIINNLDTWRAEGGAGYLEKKPHTEVIDPAVEATCTVEGMTEGSHCSVCGETIVAQENLGMLEHDWDEGRVTIEPNCTEEGVRTFTCGSCRGTKTEVEPALDHDLEYIEGKQPTYSSAGWETYERCLREDCGYTTYQQIPMLDSSEISDFTTFMKYFKILEEYANDYVAANPGKDPAMLVIKYIRTGVDRYNSGSWNIMAGYEDAGFAEYVKAREDEYNSAMTNVDDMIQVTSLKNIKNFTLPNGDYTDIGHMFGTVDISYTNVNSVNHADVSGWTGDLVDLLSLADQFGVSGTLEEMMDEIEETYFLKDESTFPEKPNEGSFSKTDFYGDLDGFYVMQQLTAEDYEPGRLYEILDNYFTEDLTLEDRADYLLKNRLGGVSNRGAIRDAVYSAYTQNQVITTLEGTREFKSENLTDLRKASCYVFADYLCKLAGDYVEENENIYFSQFSSEKSTLAPGITQEINKAYTADEKQIVYYIATADINSQYVNVYANYNESDPTLGWKMSRVRDQAVAAQNRYGDPESEDYIPNYTVVTAINGAGFDMSTGEPGGLLVMGGVEYHAPNANGFFGILKDGTAKIGTTAEYYELKEQGLIMEGIACFGATLVKDGKLAVGYTEGYTNDRASRTAVGITKTGKVVFMVLDGRQEPVSCGGSMQEIAQIMLEAGCVHAVNLDGGGSTTYLAKQEGEDSISLVSKPSDGYERSVSTSLIMVSTAPSSTEFDHAAISASPAYLTVGAQTQLTAAGVSPMGNAAELPEGTTWQVADASKGTITEDGVFTAKALGDVNVDLMLDGVSVGTVTLHVVNPTQIYFTRDSIDAVYGIAKELPLKALYNGKEVAFLESDVEFSMNNADAGVVEGFVFTASEEYTKKSVTITASLVSDSNVTASINVSLFDKGAYYFDFDNASGGTRQFAWIRDVSNTSTADNITYSVVDREEDVVATYSFGIDMTQIPMPERIADLTYMLPGADVEGASAWTFLLQLAERISPMSEVRPAITFDSDVEVDYSELSIVCEYFQLAEGGVEFDEETNTLTLRLNWKDQTQAIDPETANPICILSGIKVTPKDDAAWDSKDRLGIANVGEISYTIYMRANALYSFSQKPENQEIFGLYPYEDGSDRGGYFTDIYHKFEESYTLDKGMKNGWYFEDSGYAYYVDDEKVCGVQKVDGYYYDFGENGINVGQTKYTGIFEDGSELRYVRVGVIVTSGWPVVGEDTYHCHSDGTAHEATVTSPITCTRGGRLTYNCSECGIRETVGDFIMPNGHVWNADHICVVCRTRGKNIADATIGFGTTSNPTMPDPVPEYSYQAGGVRPSFYVTFDGITALSWSSDANVNTDGSMKDLFASWSNYRGMGKAVIEITGKGDYYGTYRLEYHIIPNDVKDLRVTATTDNTITLKWDAAAGAGYYRLYFLNDDGTRTPIAENIKGLTYTVGGLEKGMSYSFQVASSAISTDGEEKVYNCAEWSNTATGTAGETPDEGGDIPGGDVPGGNTPGGDIGGGGSGGGDIGGGDVSGDAPGDGEEDGEEEDSSEWENPFVDVSDTAYYADAVEWAVKSGVTSGTTATTFSPNRTCTRANAVAFLWRAAGSPEPVSTEMPFDDVASDAYYYKAVLWAMEQGITMGTTATTFDPNAECTRGQIVTFLWRAEKAPSVDAENPFADVKEGAYYAESVLWAVEQGITNGTTPTTFAPGNDCTRAQIVTFLWRKFCEE